MINTEARGWSIEIRQEERKMADEKPGIVRMVSRIEGGPYYTISQVADQLGRDITTIRRWIKRNPSLHPTHKMTLGDGTKGQFVWLYTYEDISRMQDYVSTLRVGRPSKESDG